MFKRTVLLLLFVTTSKCDENNNVKVHQHFKKIGYLATGLSYAHIHAKIDFQKLKIAYENVQHYVKERTRPVWTGFMTAAYHQYLVLGISADHPHLF